MKKREIKVKDMSANTNTAVIKLLENIISNQNKILEQLIELTKWGKFAAGNFHEVLLQHLEDDRDKLIYELSDGNRTTREIAKIVKITHSTVAATWKRWYACGIVEEAERTGRYKRICSLKEVGIMLPKVPEIITEELSEESNIEVIKNTHGSINDSSKI